MTDSYNPECDLSDITEVSDITHLCDEEEEVHLSKSVWLPGEKPTDAQTDSGLQQEIKL